MSEDREFMPPKTNDEWFDSHIMKRINALEYQPTGMYFLNIGLCWRRHPYKDDYEGKVNFSLFPKMVITPQKWVPNFSHCVRFLDALQAKIESFGHGVGRVDIRLYISGASGPRHAIEYAFEDEFPRKGLPYFKTPLSWRLIPMVFNSQTKEYEEEPTINGFEKL